MLCQLQRFSHIVKENIKVGPAHDYFIRSLIDHLYCNTFAPLPCDKLIKDVTELDFHIKAS